MIFLDKFITLHQQFESYHIFIGGVSYAGKYVPNVANALSNSPQYKDKLIGIFVMNGLVDTLT